MIHDGTNPKNVELVQRFGICITWSSVFTYPPIREIPESETRPAFWNVPDLWLTYPPGPPIKEIPESGSRPAFWNLPDLVISG